jgi:hypothetical protein
MPRVGFEHTIPESEWAKTVHVSDRSATVIGIYVYVYRHMLQYERRKGMNAVVISVYISD